MTSVSKPLDAVQRRALERALVDGTDARRYFALAGTLETARRPATTTDEPWTPVTRATDADGGVEPASVAVLPTALLSLAVVAAVDDGEGPVSTGGDPWSPGVDDTRTAVRRGAQVAVDRFDVSVERVAARAGLPERTLAPSEE